MNTAAILSTINAVVPLDNAETDLLASCLIARPFKQGETLVHSGEPARYLLYVNSGYVMTYYTDKDGTDCVVQFAAANWWAGDLYSLTQETNTPYTTKGLCDGEVLLLPRLAHNHLLVNSIKFERYFRITFQNALIRQQLYFIESRTDSAEERYTAFIKRYPTMEQYVPQKYIASYLGITPEFLSKLRKSLAQADLNRR